MPEAAPPPHRHRRRPPLAVASRLRHLRPRRRRRPAHQLARRRRGSGCGEYFFSSSMGSTSIGCGESAGWWLRRRREPMNSYAGGSNAHACGGRLRTSPRSVIMMSDTRCPLHLDLPLWESFQRESVSLGKINTAVLSTTTPPNTRYAVLKAALWLLGLNGRLAERLGNLWLQTARPPLISLRRQMQ